MKTARLLLLFIVTSLFSLNCKEGEPEAVATCGCLSEVKREITNQSGVLRKDEEGKPFIHLKDGSMNIFLLICNSDLALKNDIPETGKPVVFSAKSRSVGYTKDYCDSSKVSTMQTLFYHVTLTGIK